MLWVLLSNKTFAQIAVQRFLIPSYLQQHLFVGWNTTPGKPDLKHQTRSYDTSPFTFGNAGAG